MTTSTLTTYYCQFCSIVAKAFKSMFRSAIKQTCFDPKFDHKGYKQLSKLSDYELRDIGITRGDINHICSGGTVHRGRF
jgi:hypothetical protein|tara:strand:+ start:105 stop:341 length:237 start_codon:yes stop_codon:yes gene_type:complete